METRWGKRCGRYEIIAELGRGAMGVVYKARDPKIDRFVAVKAISLSGQNPEEEREYRDRFFHEAQAAGRLLHPGIVTIFDTGEEPESRIAYIVMEYIAGQSLDRLLSEKTKKLALNTALQLTEELAEALDHAHAQGVVHRDMKPANILVTSEGHAKIADFGIAKVNLAHRTIPGQALGTPAYMSPEQLEGEPVDGRSDLFSLGAILYRTVTGYGPFQGNSAATVCFKVANRDPLRATSFDYDLPPELDAVIARAMAKDPAQRYQRGLEFALDLHELRERGQAISKRGNGASRFSRAGEGTGRPASDITNDILSANFVPVGFYETPTQAETKVRSFIPLQILSWWRMPVVRTGLVFSVATIILSFFAYRQGHALRSPGQTGTPVAVGASGTPVAVAASGEPAPAVGKSQGIAHSAGKVSDSRTLSKAVADATLDIRIEHHFSAADLSLWIDDKLAYDHSLQAQTKKRWNPFRGNVKETETIRLAGGEHRLRVRVRSTLEKYEQSATISGSFAKGHPAILQINFDKRGKEMRLALR
ncbi:MAG TPA: serine/threonine-protein kinase [Terriglobales bacterium]|nr:serine/threonine-protein kinase [Terriglobales bacterium]